MTKEGPTREEKLTKKICDALSERGAYVVWQPRAKHGKGIPDLLVCYKGEFIGLEVKVGQARATPSQVEQFSEIMTAGGFAITVNSVKIALRVLDFFDEQTFRRWATQASVALRDGSQETCDRGSEDGE